MQGEMLSIGPFIFKLTTAAYNALRRSDTWRWATVDRLGNASAEQYLGPGQRTIELSGLIFTMYDAGRAVGDPDWVVGTKNPDHLRSLGDMGVPLMVVTGRGELLGKWVVVNVRETQSTFLSNGAPKQQEFNITLRHYGGEGVPEVLRGVDGIDFVSLFTSGPLVDMATGAVDVLSQAATVTDDLVAELATAGVL